MATVLLEVLSYVSIAVYGGVAVAAWGLHRRLHTEQSTWLLATFLTLASVVVMGAILPDAQTGSSLPLRVAADVLICVLLLFPYFLFRFATSFRRAARWIEILVTGAVLGIVVWTFVLPPLPEQQADYTPAMSAYLGAVLVYWTVLSLWVAWELWRGGAGQPRVARRRMQLLSIGTLVMNVALLIAGSAGDAGDAVQVVTTLLGWTSAGLFLLAFVPPGGLRHAWRQPDERELRHAEASLMTATTAEEVANTIVPHVSGLLGGHGAALLDVDGAPLASQGFTHEQLQNVVIEGHTTLDRDRLVLPLRSGTLLVQASVYAPFFGEEERELLISLGTFVDLALGRIELFDQELQTRKELERTNEELTALVYGISHDLRSPIVTVIGYLELLHSDVANELGEDGRHYLERISVSARYMDALIRDLLELSRIGRTQTEAQHVDLTDIVEDIAAELRRKHPDARFAVGQLPTVEINPVRARQLFTNLMENAVRHGGRDDITVSVSSEPTTSGQAVLTLADDGVGIAEPYRERVFGIFERLDPEGAGATTGTGIGLTMCRKIVEQMDGSIWVDPAPVGTTFKIAIPATTTQQSRKEVEVQRQ